MKIICLLCYGDGQMSIMEPDGSYTGASITCPRCIGTGKIDVESAQHGFRLMMANIRRRTEELSQATYHAQCALTALADSIELQEDEQ